MRDARWSDIRVKAKHAETCLVTAEEFEIFLGLSPLTTTECHLNLLNSIEYVYSTFIFNSRCNGITELGVRA